MSTVIPAVLNSPPAPCPECNAHDVVPRGTGFDGARGHRVPGAAVVLPGRVPATEA